MGQPLKSEMRLLVDGLAFGESPRWHNGRFWVADWGKGEILTVEQDGNLNVAVKLDVSEFTVISMDWLPDGRMIIVSSPERCLLTQEENGSLRKYANLTSLSDTGWNEIVVDGHGNAYVNSIGFDFGAGDPFAPGIIALVKPDGTVQQVAGDLAFPNGMAITPDNKTLIVAESYGNSLTAFDIAYDGSLSNRRIWAVLGEGAPDGICLDDAGAVWYADVPNQCCVRVREGGEEIERVGLDRGAFACILGGNDRKTLFIIAQAWGETETENSNVPSGQVRTLQVDTAGVGWP